MNTRKRFVALAAVVSVGVSLLAVPAASAATGAPSGAHYTLNIHGVPKGKSVPMTGSNTRSLFVNLSGKTTINLSPGDFRVLDANGTDGVAAFRLPVVDPDGDGLTAYSVYVRALGKPGGSLKATSCYTDATGTWCSTEQVALMRSKGGSKFTNVSAELLSVCADTDGDGVCDTRVPLFGDATKSYLWSVDNTGLRLAQLRFYPRATKLP